VERKGEGSRGNVRMTINRRGSSCSLIYKARKREIRAAWRPKIGYFDDHFDKIAAKQYEADQAAEAKQADTEAEAEENSRG
jgi:hypothetical protein